MSAWTLDNVLDHLVWEDRMLPVPPYTGQDHRGRRVMLAVESMRRHMTDEGWQIAAALQSAGYLLSGHGLPLPHTNVETVLARINPSIVVVQDKREWDVQPGDFREPKARFHNVEALAERPDVFKLTILKDAHQRQRYHCESAAEIGCHAWLVYYHPRLVCRMAPYVRPQHLVRTYHTLDATTVPPYSPEGRDPCLLSGAVSGAYPFRQRLVNGLSRLPGVQYHKHPGYNRNGCQTPAYLRLLSRYRVALCTCSRYGYALRRTFEATACGCRVITDLPSDEQLPAIERNLIRVSPNIDLAELSQLIQATAAGYDPQQQEHLANLARQHYDYRAEGARLAAAIEQLRSQYHEPT